jgi:spermidine/putrescine transport system permease protein
MRDRRLITGERLLQAYIVLAVIYLFMPLITMGIAAFNAYPYPSVTQWSGFTLDWFRALVADQRLMEGLRNSVLISSGVVILSLPLGLAGALVLTQIDRRSAFFLEAVLISPILVPGLIIGLSTLIFWQRFGVPGGLLLAILAQTSFISSYAMLMFRARLDRFDPDLREAAADLGASKWFFVRKVLLPFLKPTALSAAAVAFLQSFENYNTTVFSIGGDWTLVTEIGARLRFGLTPVVNVVGVIFVGLTILGSIAWAVLDRRAAAQSR